jgi:hypothetical protein
LKVKKLNREVHDEVGGGAASVELGRSVVGAVGAVVVVDVEVVVVVGLNGTEDNECGGDDDGNGSVAVIMVAFLGGKVEDVDCVDFDMGEGILVADAGGAAGVVEVAAGDT